MGTTKSNHSCLSKPVKERDDRVGCLRFLGAGHVDVVVILTFDELARQDDLLAQLTLQLDVHTYSQKIGSNNNAQNILVVKSSSATVAPICAQTRIKSNSVSNNPTLSPCDERLVKYTLFKKFIHTLKKLFYTCGERCGAFKLK